jgi:hypothetical protein
MRKKKRVMQSRRNITLFKARNEGVEKDNADVLSRQSNERSALSLKDQATDMLFCNWADLPTQC